MMKNVKNLLCVKVGIVNLYIQKFYAKRVRIHTALQHVSLLPEAKNTSMPTINWEMIAF